MPAVPYRLARYVEGKRCYVEFYVTDETRNALVRKRIQVEGETDKARRADGQTKVREINALLKSGYRIQADGAKAADQARAKSVPELLADVYQVYAPTVGPRGKESARYVTSRFADWCHATGWHSRPARNFGTPEARLYMDHLLATPVAPRTYNNHLTALKTLCRWAVERNWLQRNPFAPIKPLAQPEPARRAFTDVEARRLTDWLAAHDPYLYRFTRFVYYAYIRPVELCRLQVRHVDLAARRVVVPGELAKNKRTQAVHIPPPLAAVIGDMGLGSLPPDWHLFGRGGAPGPVAWDRTRVSERHAQGQQAAGVVAPGLSLYSWKDTGACKAVQGGLSIIALQKQLRHGSLRQTEKYLRSLGLNEIGPEFDKVNW